MFIATLRMDRSPTQRLMTCCSNRLDIQSTNTSISPAASTLSLKFSKLMRVGPTVRRMDSSSSMTTGSRSRLCSTATPQTIQENTFSSRRIPVDCGNVLLSTRATKRMMVSEDSSDTARRSQNWWRRNRTSTLTMSATIAST